MVEKLLQKVLIVSLGSIGRRHLRNLRLLLPDAELAVLRRQGAAEDADRVFHDLPSALAFKPDAAIVASPASAHLASASALVKQAVPVLVEKPFADRLDGLPQLVADAEAAGVPLFVAYNLRFHPLLQKVRGILAVNGIGRVLSVRSEVGQYLPDWRPGKPYRTGVSARRDLGGGALLELSHELDYICWLFGRPALVFAAGGPLGDLGIDVEDTVSLTLRYGDAAPIVNVHLDFLQRAVTRQFRIVGSEGTIVGNMITGELDLYLAQTGNWMREICRPAEPNQLYLDEIGDFFSAVQDGDAIVLPDGRQGMDVICLVEAARRSMAERKEVKIDYV
ncbi:Gfo/Idh/MocA family protein [Rhizobium wuzhouense]|uniref:Gfo/Idh/MocA family oxidoreductase n=1 Tax=Rhizobium wuzhouense TaxID=1986026 RepID=A0ABX5NXL7_9HYPH|nr:Gfo/Idh/MocA family oxidoreductase [Rhizobium wuzhouense]PYB77097.1 hypothetical protein DMY87_01595 [Rhizobium wuzhouense]